MPVTLHSPEQKPPVYEIEVVGAAELLSRAQIEDLSRRLGEFLGIPDATLLSPQARAYLDALMDVVHQEAEEVAWLGKRRFDSDAVAYHARRLIKHLDAETKKRE